MSSAIVEGAAAGLRRPRSASSPFFTVCFGALQLTCFGFGASTCLQPSALPAAVVVESPLAAAARDQDRGDDAARDHREDGEDDPASVGLRSSIGAKA